MGDGVLLRILEIGLVTSTATAALLLTMLRSIGEFYRRMMLERHRQG
jgi:hypothetical protein